MKQRNQSWDINGNLVFDEWVDVPEPDAPTLDEIAQNAGVDITTLLSQVQQALKQ